jgi:ATP-dependent DNA helicase RecQ
LEYTPPIEILRQYWGFDVFRPLQEDIIKSALDGNDTLALLPTGGGKSICFQVPAHCKEGITLVISPLIALMKDQVYNLRKRNIKAEAIYSGMHFKDIDRVLDNCIYGEIKLLYLSPERLTSELAMERIKQMNINLIAVDEAHCISQWGYDFRPAYLKIAEIREWYAKKIPILALTATATTEVVKDIQEKLEFKNANVFQNSFSRSNLAYVVLHEEHKAGKLLKIVQNVKGSGVVYVRSRKKTKDFATFLQRNGISADFYHAGLSPVERSKKQEEWINSKTRIIVSTNAFGMGIDKADVRSVVHMDLPDNLEAYFQEAGRGGRDGMKAYAVLLYNEADKINLERQYELAFPDLKEVRRVYQAIGSFLQLAIGSGKGESFDFDLITFSKNYGFDAIKAFNCLKILEDGAWLTMSEAVYIPSKLNVLVSKEELYDFQLKNRNYDLLVKTILRTYQGAFNNFVNLNEYQLANFMKISGAGLSKLFQTLSQLGIIDYRPQKDQPQLTLLEERTDTKNLILDKKLYDFRKKRHKERIERAIAYAEEKICRSKQLLAYFGEFDAADCGICDICLERNKSGLNNEAFKKYEGKIRMILKDGPLSLENIVDSFGSSRKTQILKTIAYLVDEGLLVEENGKFDFVD